ncbi:hypothetical protein JCM5350_002944 [Sporobolomyces pararoseus]
MPFVIPEPADHSNLIQSVPLGLFCRFAAATLPDKINESTRINYPSGYAVDGWLAAVQSLEVGGRTLDSDPIVRALLEKQISPSGIDLESIASPRCLLKSTSESENYTRYVEFCWDKLCRSQNEHGPIDHLQLHMNFIPSRKSPIRDCLVSVRQYQPFPLSIDLCPPGVFQSYDPNRFVAPFFVNSAHSHRKVTLPKSSVFFFSRLDRLRQLDRQLNILKDHQHTSRCTCLDKIEVVEDRISQVVLQMLLYFRSMTQSPDSATTLACKTLDWIILVNLGDKLGNDIFGSFGARQNLEYLKKEQGYFDSIWRRAVRWTGYQDEGEVVEACEEMKKWLCGQFEEIVRFKDRENQRRKDYRQGRAEEAKKGRDSSTEKEEDLWKYQPRARRSRGHR